MVSESSQSVALIALIVALLACGASVVLTGAIRDWVLRVGLLDRPTDRSSHEIPTARGGGLAIAATCIVAWCALWAAGLVETTIVAALVAGGSLVAAVGFVDDLRGLPASLRLVAYLAAAALAVVILWIGHGHSLATASLPEWRNLVAWTIGIALFLNLFNFMDGIDGLAAGEAVFVAFAAALLRLANDGGLGAALPALALGGAALGFLRWNWPPAKIFMGDVGSVFIGFALATLAAASSLESTPALFPWLTLVALFLADSLFTLARRWLRRHRPHQAHRTHAYQRLARRWGSHARVTVLAATINVVWLLPLAWRGWHAPGDAVAIFLLAIAPLVLGVALAGAGRDD